MRSSWWPFPRHCIAGILALIFLTGALGCSEFLNGKKIDPEVIEFSDQRFVCLQTIPDQLEEFSLGIAEEQEIRQGFDCMAEALTYFNRKTYGSLPNAYTIEEMRRFFGKYFLKKNNVTAEFAAELMKIKRALLGGSIGHITKDEIVSLVELLRLMRDEAVELAPHVKVLLTQAEQKNTNWEQISSAIDQLRRSLKRLLEKTQIAKSDYSFDDVKNALSGLAEFIRGQEPFAPYQKYSRWVPMVESVKIVLMGRRAQFVGVHQWSGALDTLLDLYELALKYHYVIGDFEFDEKSKLRQGLQFLHQGLKLLENSHQMKNIGRIPVEDLDNLIDKALPQMTNLISTRALKKSYKVVLLKILDPVRLGDSRSLMGLERKHLLSLERELNIFRLHQSFIDSLSWTEHDGFSQSQLVKAYKDFNAKMIIEKGLTEDAFEQKALHNAWSDIGALLDSPNMLVFDVSGHLVISRSSATVKQNWTSLTKFNLMRALARMLMLGYADNVSGKMTAAGMSEAALVAWYDDFQELGLEIKAFDPRSANSGPRSFLEANFFTFSGNGDDLMNQSEAVEFVSTLFSAGLATSNKVAGHMKKAGCAVGDLKDVFGLPYYQQDCFQRQLQQHMSIYFANMPGMVHYVHSLNQAEWNQFFGFLLSASLVQGQKAGLIETANIRTMVTILHYIESVMVIYDRDRNSGLSVDEVYAAAPRFMSFFKKVNPGTYEFLIKEGFAHLVFFGNIPGAGGVASFQLKKLWGIDDARRMEIARLFGTLKEQLNTVEN